MATGVVRQTGLDKEMEDILFGQRRSYHQLGKYPPYVRRSDMAQMLSEDKLLAWPYAVLAHSQDSRTISSFYNIEGISPGYVESLNSIVKLRCL